MCYHTQRLLLIRGAGRFRKARIHFHVACDTSSLDIPRYPVRTPITPHLTFDVYSPMLAFSVLWANAKKLRRAAWYARKRWYPLLAVAEELEDEEKEREGERFSPAIRKRRATRNKWIPANEIDERANEMRGWRAPGNWYISLSVLRCCSRSQRHEPRVNFDCDCVTARAIFPLAALSSLDFILVSLANRSDPRPLYERISRCAKISPAFLSQWDLSERRITSSTLKWSF